VIGRGVVKFPPTEGLVKLLLVVPEDRDVDITSIFLADWESFRARAPPFAARWATRRWIFRAGRSFCILGSVFKQMARALVGGGRFVFGASFLLAPSPILRIWWPDDAASGPIALGLARGLGARDAALGLGILAAVLRRESSRGWLLAAAGADAADLVLTLTNAWPFGRRTRLLTLAGIALNVMVDLYLAFDQEY
jgi:hypothetical protein